MAPILFLHIPRTGGMSLKQMCVEALGTSRCLTDVHFLRVEREHGFRLGDFDFVEGHVVAGFFDLTDAAAAWPDRGYTVLRDPVARVVSQAVHVRHRPEQVRGDEWRAALRAEVRDPHDVFDRVPALTDLQTRQLGFPPFRWHHRQADESAYAAATALLDQMPFGLTEAFAVSTALFADRFGLLLPGIARTNASPVTGDEDLRSAEFAAVARERNGFDRRLHEFAVERFAVRQRAHAAALLDLDAEEAPVDLRIGSPVPGADGMIPVTADATEIVVHGTLVLGGAPAEAALVRSGDNLVPVGCRFASPRQAEATGDPGQRFVGIEGRVPVPAGVSSLEVIAVDRTRRRRGSVRIGLTQR